MTDLKPYQLEGVDFLAARKRAMLADDMGLGKSSEVVGACDKIGAQRILVLVPASGRVNWLNEFKKFSSVERPGCAIMHGKVADLPDGVVVCSYDIAANAHARKVLASIDWDVLVLDEAHYLKSRTAKRTKAVYGRRCDGLEGLAPKAKRWWCLSGTPAPNNVSELWTHLHAHGLYPKPWFDFVGEYCKGFDSDYGFRITGTKNGPKLKKLMEPWVLRRKKDDVLGDELPPITFETRYLEPGPVDVPIHFMGWLQGRSIEEFNAEMEATNALLKDALGGLKGNLPPAIQTQLSGVAQLRRYVGLSIVQSYVDAVGPELESGAIDKLVVFAHHAGVIDWVQSAFKDFGAVTLYGATPAEKRERRVDKFQRNPKCRVLVGNLVAAGTAITLHSACRLDFLETSWVPGENQQAAMRIHRIGQTRPCHVRFFGCARGIHRDILDACARKTSELVKAGL